MGEDARARTGATPVATSSAPMLQFLLLFSLNSIIILELIIGDITSTQKKNLVVLLSVVELLDLNFLY